MFYREGRADVRDLKLPVVIAVFLVVVALGVGLQHVYYQKRVIAPLADDAHAIVGVESVNVVTRGDGLKDVWVDLHPEARIEEVYPQIEDLAASSLRGMFGRVVVNDNPGTRLREIYHQIHFSVQEGISTGLFAHMAEEIDRQLENEEGVAHRVYVGDRYVYVHLKDENGDLYEVIPRPSGLVASAPATTGGRN